MSSSRQSKVVARRPNLPAGHSVASEAGRRGRTQSRTTWSQCARCGTVLTDSYSRRVGFGRECRETYSMRELGDPATYNRERALRAIVENVTLDELWSDDRGR